MLKWIGDTKGVACFPGIPARDLTAGEIVVYGGETFLLSTGLWELTEKEKPAKKTKAETLNDE